MSSKKKKKEKLLIINLDILNKKKKYLIVAKHVGTHNTCKYTKSRVKTVMILNQLKGSVF